MLVHLLEAPFTDAFISEFTQAAKNVFASNTDQAWLDGLRWRLERMPDVTACIAQKDSRLIGFKIGYATAHHRYYSWLGGVAPDFRRQGIAKQLMSHQHKWLGASRFQLVEAHVEQSNHAMIQLNLNGGLSVTGFFLKDGKPHLLMHKNIVRD